MRRPTFLAAVLLLVLTGCTAPTTGSNPSPEATAEADFLETYGLDGMAARQSIDRLDPMPVAERPTGLMASVRVDELVLSDANNEVAVPIGEDGFYLSMAPYVDRTHECFYHSLTTCRGELANTRIGVRIADAAGAVLVDEQVTTFDNGFAGFWLPRDVQGTIEVTYEGRVAVGGFSTNAEGATCVTTLKLEV